MRGKTEYIHAATGTVVGGLGAFQSFTHLGTLNEVFVWGLACVFGLFALAFGVRSTLTARDGDSTADPNEALGKTDSRFGQR